MTKIVIEGTKIISYGYGNYQAQEGQEIIDIDNYPYGARKQDVYWDGEKVKYKTQGMKEIEIVIEKDKKDKKELDNKISDKLIEVLIEMIGGTISTDFNILIDKLKE